MMDYLKLKLKTIRDDMDVIGYYAGYGQAFIDCIISLLLSGILLFYIIKDICILQYFYIDSMYFYMFLGFFLFLATYMALGVEPVSPAKRICMIFAPAMLFFEFVLLENWYEMGFILFIIMIVAIEACFAKYIVKMTHSESFTAGVSLFFKMITDIILLASLIGFIAFSMNRAYDLCQLIEKEAQEENTVYIANQENNNQNFDIIEEVQDERI